MSKDDGREYIIAHPTLKAILPHTSNEQEFAYMILAYIDPGSGSILIQVVFASCIGGIVVFWNKIKSLFSRRKPNGDPSSGDGKKSE